MSLNMQMPSRDLLNGIGRSLKNDGIAVIPNALDQESIACVNAEFERIAAEDDLEGRLIRGSSFDPDKLNIRLTNLPGRGQIFREILEHPLVVQAVEVALGPLFRLSNFTANITTPGAGAMSIHSDQNYIPEPWPIYPVSVNVGFALDEFTDLNATRFVPGTHRTYGPPVWDSTQLSTVPICAPAGSMFLMDGRLWHQTGANRSKGNRAAMFAYFTLPFIVPQAPWHNQIEPELQQRLSPYLLELLHFGQTASTAYFKPGQRTEVKEV